jgi:hypothetical protein
MPRRVRCSSRYSSKLSSIDPPKAMSSWVDATAVPSRVPAGSAVPIYGTWIVFGVAVKIASIRFSMTIERPRVSNNWLSAAPPRSRPTRKYWTAMPSTNSSGTAIKRVRYGSMPRAATSA